MKLSDTQLVILSAAAKHEMGLARAPKGLPAAARNAVFRSLIKNNLLTEINAQPDHVGLGWRQDEDGTWIVARITDDGLRAIGIDPNEGNAAADTAPTDAEKAAPQQEDAQAAEATQNAPVAAPRASLRSAAEAVVTAWDAKTSRPTESDESLRSAIEILRPFIRAFARATAREAFRDALKAARKPREGTKQEAVLALLRRDEGATIAQIIEATGWQSHTVRGFLAGLKRKGITVEVLERVRQVGPSKEGAKGSYSIYRITG
jgi:hypothetical protein